MTGGETSSAVEADVLVVGGGASGVAAALQAARMGARVLVIEETLWLGGMLTSAGVSALDGNDAILSGIHREFVEAVRSRHGGPEAVKTGWVSNTLFAPSVGQAILRRLVDAEPNITLWMETRVARVLRRGNRILGVETADGRTARAPVTIEATEFGDLLRLGDVPHRFGREGRDQTGESSAPPVADGIVQDSTYCLTLRDHGAGADFTTPAPPGYDAAKYDGSVREVASDPNTDAHTVHTWESMITYGRLPGNLCMINWPIHGNDFFAPELITGPPEERPAVYRRMKDHALGFLHYIQTVAGHPEFAIAEGEYPTPDGLPLCPYIRESRRIEAVVVLRLDDVVDRHAQSERPLYKTGIAVGDYFIDHHHTTTLDTDPLRPTENFPPIQAVTVPLGCLIPAEIEGLLAAEKSIGVTHSVNGVTRLQPVVMNIGQAAGALAALAAKRNLASRQVPARDVQQTLLDAGALLMPLADVAPQRWSAQSIQRTLLSGVLRTFDEPRRCEFRPEQLVRCREARAALTQALAKSEVSLKTVSLEGDEPLTRAEMALAVHELLRWPAPEMIATHFRDVDSSENFFEAVQHFHDAAFDAGWVTSDEFQPSNPVTREQLAVTIDRAFDPFRRLPVGIACP
jgi:hypothetical protein